MAIDKPKNARKPSKKQSARIEPVVDSPERVGERFARTTAPRELQNAELREKWGLPALDEPDEPGPYIIELNGEHLGGLPGASSAFMELYKSKVQTAPDTVADSTAANISTAPGSFSERKPVRIAKSYYWCLLSDNEWRALVHDDEARPRRDRSIYRLWPDFPVESHTDRSIITVKADAAMRAFDAGGDKIVWAVVDSGIDANHLHFGSRDTKDIDRHTLRASEVADLHRCFAPVGDGGTPYPLPDPDADPNITPVERSRLLEEHRNWALRDEYGHGTHVAGIIAGRAPAEGSKVVALERQYKVDDDGKKIEVTFATRTFENSAMRPSGVAPRCKLVSLRVLDRAGKGRSSRVIQALEYIRERINDNPKMMRVHGVNLSVGYEYDAEMFACGLSPLCTAVDRLVQEGVVVVTAAGNTGYGTAAAAVGFAKMSLSNSINDPGNAAQAITVGSTHRDSPHTYGVSYFSSKGPTGDGRVKPDLVAPGERITSCASGQKLIKAQKEEGSVQDDATAVYVDDSGTSMAAPHVSGAIAAFLSIRREFIGKPQEVKQLFLNSATPLGRERYFEGHGLVDLMRAIQSV